MNIRFTSSLTPEDENMIAPTVIKAVSAILDLLPIVYMIRIDTSDGQVFQHTDAKSYIAPDSVAVRTRNGAPAEFEFR